MMHSVPYPLLWLAAVVLLLLTSCMSISDMTSQQIRATSGMAMCAQVTSMYGKGSSIMVNADDIRKGATAKGKTVISCGDASMTIENDVGAAK